MAGDRNVGIEWVGYGFLLSITHGGKSVGVWSPCGNVVNVNDLLGALRQLSVHGAE